MGGKFIKLSNLSKLYDIISLNNIPILPAFEISELFTSQRGFPQNDATIIQKITLLESLDFDHHGYIRPVRHVKLLKI